MLDLAFAALTNIEHLEIYECLWTVCKKQSAPSQRTNYSCDRFSFS